MKDKLGIIYAVANRITGKIYVGQTQRSLAVRKREHETKKKIRGLYCSIEKYGKKNFYWYILEKCQIEKLNKREQYYIRKLETFNKGYNLTKGGDNIFGASGEFHYLNLMNKEDKEKWLESYRLGKNNPNYNNHVIKGKNHYINKMSKEEKEQWLNKNLRGKENYQAKLTKEELKNKCWINKLSVKEKKKWIEKNLKGNNNPFKKAYLKNPEKYKRDK